MSDRRARKELFDARFRPRISGRSTWCLLLIIMHDTEGLDSLRISAEFFAVGMAGVLVTRPQRIQPLNFLVAHGELFPLLRFSRLLHEFLKCFFCFFLVLPLDILFDHLIKAFALLGR